MKLSPDNLKCVWRNAASCHQHTTICVLITTIVIAACACRPLENRTSEQSVNAAPDNAQVAANPTAANSETPADVWEKVPVVQLRPYRQATLKKGVTSMLNSWQTSIEKKDVAAYLRNYADRVEVYYLQRDIDKTVVRNEFNRVFGRLDSINLELKNIEIKPTATDAATVIFDKSWDFKGAAQNSTGSVQQIIKVQNIDRRWRIVSERDWQVYKN